MEKLEVTNISRYTLTFALHKNLGDLTGIPHHKRDKMMRSSVTNIMIPSNNSKDLVKESGMTVDDIEHDPEYIKILRGNVCRLVVINRVTSSDVPEEKPVVEPTPVVPAPVAPEPIPEVKEPEKVPEPVLEPEKAEEPLPVAPEPIPEEPDSKVITKPVQKKSQKSKK